jgi:methanogenic corrinoid protein MtbC1
VRSCREALEEAGIREQVKVIVGGARVSQEWAKTIGADGYAEDAVGAIELAKHLLRGVMRSATP